MQIQQDPNQQQIPTYNFNHNPNYSRFLFFLGMLGVAVLTVGILTAISNRANPIANSNHENAEVYPLLEVEPQPIIVNVPDQPSPDNPLGLTLDEYANLSDPSEEMLNCLQNEGGKGCFKPEYQPNLPDGYNQNSGQSYQAVRVYNGQVLDNWYPSQMPPIPQGACHKFYMVKYNGRYYCGRRLIQQD